MSVRTDIIRALIHEGTTLAGELAARVPQQRLYRLVLSDLGEISAYRLPQNATAASSIASKLGKFAARQLDDATGSAAELAEVLHRLSGELGRLVEEQ